MSLAVLAAAMTPPITPECRPGAVGVSDLHGYPPGEVQTREQALAFYAERVDRGGYWILGEDDNGYLLKGGEALRKVTFLEEGPSYFEVAGFVDCLSS